ncbi:MAG: hypothetical protein ACR2RE_04040, partial [Geminicoccaceae bacterium]
MPSAKGIAVIVQAIREGQLNPPGALAAFEQQRALHQRLTKTEVAERLGTTLISLTNALQEGRIAKNQRGFDEGKTGKLADFIENGTLPERVNRNAEPAVIVQAIREGQLNPPGALAA